jgi:DNA-directed RNA polymerase specialized sigma24 family protein
VSQKQQIIIAAYLENKAKKTIAREWGVNVKTVRSILRSMRARQAQKLLDAGTPIDDIRDQTDSIVEKPA